ncbi:MAG TPA: alpha-amylase, partial [Hyphomonas sp.]|nr:alpha-amylase [Hyphomonas sp.]
DPAPAMAEAYGLARLRRGSALGLLTDAISMPEFALSLVQHFREGTQLAAKHSSDESVLRFLPESGLDDVAWADQMSVDWFGGEQSNSSIIVGNLVVIKLVRRLREGVHPEAEMTRHLTRAGYANGTSLLGELVRARNNGEAATVALLTAYVANQGDAWTWT